MQDILTNGTPLSCPKVPPSGFGELLVNEFALFIVRQIHLTNVIDCFCNLVYMLQSVTFTFAKLARDVKPAGLPLVAFFEKNLLQVKFYV